MAVQTFPQRITEPFSRFFSAYPWREVNPRARALKAFARLVDEDGQDPEVLVAAAGRFAEVVKTARIKSIFVPHAATWLNQRDFEDYLEADAPVPAEPAQPAPEHPLAWMRGHMTAAAWTAWIKPLMALETGDGVTITARLAFARDRVNSEYGHLLVRRYGQVTWTLAERSDT
ncbi:hypothetical protein GVN24_24640 [Rhizobium sp. CRIBSB]|nr:hypothetical protein [Rhizobium sp. CRIBSB]